MNSPVVVETPPPAGLADSAGGAVGNDGQVPIRGVVSALWKRCRALLPVDSRILFSDRETKEAFLDTLGSVDIRQSPAGCFAETSAKGELTRARTTALLRLTEFTGGDNRRGVKIAAERPLKLRRRDPGLWQFSIRLSDIEDPTVVPVPRTRRVRVVYQVPITYAILVCRGHPTERVMQRAELAIMDSIARSRWFASGAPVVRIFEPNALLPFTASFELAVPVMAQEQFVPCRASPHGDTAVNRPASQAGPAVH